MSSILIKGMEMPKNCAECKMWSICDCLKEFDDYESLLYAVDDGDWVMADDCPLVELPPHGRLIAEKTITEIRYHDADGYHIVNGEQLCELEIDAETVIEAEGENDGR